MNGLRASRHRRSEAGVALLIAIFSLLLISTVAIAMIVASGTESALDANYRASSQAFYAAIAGLEEGRGRLSTAHPSTLLNGAILPAPGGLLAVGQVRYVLNPAAGETVDPTSSTNPYYDNEIASEVSGPVTVRSEERRVGKEC